MYCSHLLIPKYLPWNLAKSNLGAGRERKRGRKKDRDRRKLASVDCLPKYLKLWWVHWPEVEADSSIWIFQMGGRDPTTWAITCLFLGDALIGSWNQKLSRHSNPGLPICFVVVLTRVLTPGQDFCSNLCPENAQCQSYWFLKPRFKTALDIPLSLVVLKYYLFERKSECMRERIFFLLIYSPNTCDNLGWARP